MKRQALVAAMLLASSLAGAKPTEDAPHARCPAWSGESATVDVSWSQTTHTPPCWFFSGPASLGRDDHLGSSAQWVRNAGQVELRFGAAVFTGTIAGRSVSLRRASAHDGWRVTETIRGELHVEASCTFFSGSYHYDECNTPTGCPGQCHIDSALRVQRH